MSFGQTAARSILAWPVLVWGTLAATAVGLLRLIVCTQLNLRCHVTNFSL